MFKNGNCSTKIITFHNILLEFPSQDEEMMGLGFEISLNPELRTSSKNKFHYTFMKSMCEIKRILNKYLLFVFAIILYYCFLYIKMSKNTLRKKKS